METSMAHNDDSNAAAMRDVCCYEDNEPMGALGRTLHYRCRACGWMWSERLVDTTEDELKNSEPLMAGTQWKFEPATTTKEQS